MQLLKYADALVSSPRFSLVRDEREKHQGHVQRARIAKTNAVREVNATIAAEAEARDARREAERAQTHGPRLRFELVDGLISKQVDQRIALGRRAGDVGHRTVAFYLADCADRGLFQELGHASVISYATRRHHFSRRQARDLIEAGRALRDLPKIDRAFFANEIAWSKVRAIARIADSSTEDQWLAYALSHTTDEIETETSLAKKGEKPRADRKGSSETRFDVRLRVSGLVHEQVLLARQRMTAEAGHPVTDEEFAGVLAESFLRKPAEGIVSSDSLFRVVLDLRPADGTATLRTERGSIPISAAKAGAGVCDAGVVAGEDGAQPDHPHEYAPPISESLRKRILARDGYRCLVCRRGLRFHVHHVEWRSQGGSNAEGNLMTACVRCHELVHDGLLDITGTAPSKLVYRDRTGQLLDDPSRVVEAGDSRALEVGLATPASDPEGGGAGAPPNSGFCAEKHEVLATVPTHPVDRDWLARHKHLVEFSRTRSGFVVKEGTPLAVVPARLKEGGARAAARPAECASPTEGGAGAPTNALRPEGFGEVVGQRKVIERLRGYAASAKASGRKAAPVLLLGDPGVGKTTLARAYAHELRGKLKTIDSSLVRDPGDLVSRLLDLEDGDVVFLDEIHALPKLVAECLYPAIEDGCLHLPFVDGILTRTVIYRLPKVTFVAATTNPELVPAPLITRFRTVELSPYGVDDLVEIVLRAARRDGVPVDRDAAEILAKASGGAGRSAIGLYVDLRTVFERRTGARATGGASATDAAGPGGASANAEDARVALAAAEIDERGIGPRHQRILGVLRRYRRAIGVRRLASEAGLTDQAYRTLYEPVLVRTRAIEATRWGVRLGDGARPATV